MSRSALTAALNNADSPTADFALSSRRLPSAMKEDLEASAGLALGSSVDARSNYLSSSLVGSLSSVKSRREVSQLPAFSCSRAPGVAYASRRVSLWVCDTNGAVTAQVP